ncbi:MAG: NADH-quinone oxidoreductase subunit N [Candidatus Cloacimonetes bacterium]|nr:NADH-quinone oxidoreductase subunit N [Candidatus Cloacimonadota bacterium]
MDFFIAPEFLTALLALFVLCSDFFLKEKKEHIVPAITVSGAMLILTVSFAFPFIGESSLLNSLFNGFETSLGKFATYSNDYLSLFGSRLLLVSLVLTTLLSWDYIQKRTKKITEFYALLIFATCGLMFMVSAQELLTFFVSLETASMCLYALSAYFTDNKYSLEAGLKYFLLGASFSALMLYGIVLVYGACGTTNYAQIATVISTIGESGNTNFLYAGVVLICIGFAFKLSLAPFHMWAPDVLQGAPTPISAFLSVSSKAAGFMVLIRLTSVAFTQMNPVWVKFFLICAIVSMIFGNLIAVWQTNMKRLMAYSSIGQVSYLVMGIIATNDVGTSALLYFLVSYVFTTLSIFIVIACVSKHDGDDMADFYGLSKRSPFVAMVATIGILSLCGIPPMSGFFAKFYVFAAAIKSKYFTLVFFALIATTVSLFYYLNVLRAMYIDGDESHNTPLEVANSSKVGMWLCLIGMMYFGIFPQQLVTFCNQVAVSL